MKRSTIVGSMSLVALIAIFSGCGGAEEETSKVTPVPTIEVTALEVINNGSELSWKINVNNAHPSTHIKVAPWNDTTYYFSSLGKSYSDSVALECNTQVQGTYLKCNDIDEIVCDRVLIGSDYSEYRCNPLVKGVIYPQYKDKMRVATMSDANPSEEVLLTVGTQHWYESNGYEASRYISEKRTNKMFNVFRGDVGE